MKILEGFVKKPIMDEIVVVATGEASKNFHGLIKLNQTASFIWDEVAAGKTQDEIVKDLTDEYKVSEKQAAKDVEEIISQMKDQGIIVDD